MGVDRHGQGISYLLELGSNARVYKCYKLGLYFSQKLRVELKKKSSLKLPGATVRYFKNIKLSERMLPLKIASNWRKRFVGPIIEFLKSYLKFSTWIFF